MARASGSSRRAAISTPVGVTMSGRDGRVYTINFTASNTLSGGDFVSGSLSVKVMDHGDHEGIIWFFVGGATPK